MVETTLKNYIRILLVQCVVMNIVTAVAVATKLVEQLSSRVLAQVLKSL